MVWSIVLTPLELGSSRSRSCWGRAPFAAVHRGGGPAGSTGELWREIEDARDRDTEIKIHVQKEKGGGRKEVGGREVGRERERKNGFANPFTVDQNVTLKTREHTHRIPHPNTAAWAVKFLAYALK